MLMASAFLNAMFAQLRPSIALLAERNHTLIQSLLYIQNITINRSRIYVTSHYLNKLVVDRLIIVDSGLDQGKDARN